MALCAFCSSQSTINSRKTIWLIISTVKQCYFIIIVVIRLLNFFLTSKKKKHRDRHRAGVRNEIERTKWKKLFSKYKILLMMIKIEMTQWRCFALNLLHCFEWPGIAHLAERRASRHNEIGKWENSSSKRQTNIQIITK